MNVPDRRERAGPEENDMRFYLTSVAFGLLMFGVCVLLLQLHPLPQPGDSLRSLFGAAHEAPAQRACTQGGALAA